MKKDELKRDYDCFEELKKAYDEAKNTSDENGMETAKAAYKELLDSVHEKGDEYCFMSRLYNEMRERGNERIDISEPYQYEDARKLIGRLKDFGFECFTFSSTWKRRIGNCVGIYTERLHDGRHGRNQRQQQSIYE